MNNRRPNRPSKRTKDWSSSVIGSHSKPSSRSSSRMRAAGSSSRSHQASSRRHTPGHAPLSGSRSSRTAIPQNGRTSSYSTRRRTQAVNKRSAEIRQMKVHATSVDERRASRQRGKSRTEDFMNKKRRFNVAIIAVVVALVVFLAFGIGSCVFKNSISGGMAINDDTVTSQLKPVEEGQPAYILIAGLADAGTTKETASYITVLRVDQANKTFTFLNIPNNISASFSEGTNTMLRDAPHLDGEGALVSKVSEMLGVDINHYMSISDKGLIDLVDSLGGLDIDVTQRVDDPRVSSVVLDVGQQTLNGEQVLCYVSAWNYVNGRTIRAQHQQEVLSALITKMLNKGGLDFMSMADKLSGTVKTDMDYATLEGLASAYSSDATVYSASLPSSQSVVNNVTYASVQTAAWDKMKNRFINGEEPSTSVDTSGVDKSKLSIIVLNGSGAAGLALQASDKLTAAGYTVQETGNADSYVYNETLVIYRSEEDKAAAEAIVQDLGVGRAVYANVYYSLKTNIQVVVGKDWAV